MCIYDKDSSEIVVSKKNPGARVLDAVTAVDLWRLGLKVAGSSPSHRLLTSPHLNTTFLTMMHTASMKEVRLFVDDI